MLFKMRTAPVINSTILITAGLTRELLGSPLKNRIGSNYLSGCEDNLIRLSPFIVLRSFF
jgi:hypothetical protein